MLILISTEKALNKIQCSFKTSTLQKTVTEDNFLTLKSAYMKSSPVTSSLKVKDKCFPPMVRNEARISTLTT